MTQTNNLKIDLVAQSQSQKEVTINEAVVRLEAVQNRGVVDKDLATPPGAPAEGAAYIVAATATGAWTGKETNIAYYNNGWRFIAANEGLLVWVNDEDKVYVFNGTAWVNYSDNLQNLAKLGINAAADTTNKLSVSSDAVLFSHNGTDMRTKLNKNASGNTASFLFQDGFSGRAEFGLIGNDDFTLKVSPDGSVWNNAFVVDKTTGKIAIGGGTPVAKILSSTASLDFPNILANTSSDLTIAVTGATTGSSVELGLPAAPTTGIIYMGFVSAADVVTVRAFNVTAGAINPASQSFRATVLVF